ncbi:MAG: NAD(P)-dependent glycerol-3-phosphate dehydrogenase [Alphaproteobacteria bacterium]|nr:NAD(P)-dependent glycerol-3-phosphate dehydrogenase [Alphaproteobacteria bacterium]
MKINSIAIIGGGAWGTALATVARRAGRDVTLWAFEAETVAAINNGHENTAFLPGIPLDEKIHATNDLGLATGIADADAVLLATPAQHLRATAETLATTLPPHLPAVICAKGIELESGLLMSEVARETLPDSPLAVLSGPTFATEVAREQPAAVTLACGDAQTGKALVAALGTRYFRPYLSDDVTACEIGGAVKNVLAVASGIVIGRGLGENARAALVTRGLAEMVRLGVAKGAQAVSMMGLCGFGDLLLTCTSAQSRNMSLGIRLGEGEALGDVLGRRTTVAEGVFTAAPVVSLARRMGVEMPICEAVDQVLNHGANIDETIAGLLDRPFTSEA